MTRPLLTAFLSFAIGALACVEEGAESPPVTVPPEPRLDPAEVVIDSARRTTSPEVALANLEASIDGARAHYEATRIASSRSRLITLLDLRATMTGAYDDFLALDQLTLEAVELTGGSVQALEERAGHLSAVHLFEEARAVLDQAEAAGARPDALEGERLVIDLAIGVDPESLLPVAEERARASGTYDDHARLAGVLAALGRFEEADAAYRDALATYRDVSPFPVAWNAFQRGVMWAEAADRPDLARPLYEEAVRRFPSYPVANVHLAELEAQAGELDRAMARLRRLVTDGVGDPEPAGFLAELGAVDAPELLSVATARYEVLLGRHREAFADHGSEFFAGPGGDPVRGLELALFNLSNRVNPRAYLVALGAALAAGDQVTRCRLAREAEPLGARHPVLRSEVDAALSECPAP